MCNRPASLLSLPTEIRLKVFEYVAVSPYRLKSPYCIDIEGRMAKLQLAEVNDISAILQTCQQLYDEALTTFYAKNVFTYDNFHYNTGFPSCHLYLVKRLYLDVWAFDMSDENKRITSFVRHFDRHCPFLQSLTVTFLGWIALHRLGRLMPPYTRLKSYSQLSSVLMKITMKAQLRIYFAGPTHSSSRAFTCLHPGLGRREDWKVTETVGCFCYDYQPRQV